ncbi:MAG: FliH/SctL family protein [Opitutaceae bacterium]
MSSPEHVRFFQPLRSVRLAGHRAPALTQAQIDALLQESYQRGYSDASAHITQQIVEQRNDVNHLRETLFRSLEEAVAGAVAEVRAALPALTMQALRRVLARVQIDRATVTGVVEELLSEIGPDVGPTELRLHPEDLALAEGLEAQLASIHPGLRLVGDESLARGDCQAVTRFGKVDARLQNKVEKLETSFLSS